MSIPSKKWMDAERHSAEFREGVQSFIRFAKDTVGADKSFLCPCLKCKLFSARKQYPLEEIHLHLIQNGFLKTYRTWIHHGEKPRRNVVNVNQATNLPGNIVHCENSGRGVVNMFSDLQRRIDLDNHMEDCFNDPNQESGDNVEGDQGADINYKKRIEDSLQPLYPSCDGQHTKLSTTIELLSMKARHNCSDAFLTELLQFMKTILPAGNTLPATTNKAKAMIEPFRLKCEIIHACPNDCILYRKDYADKDECPNCKASRWKPVDKKKPHAKRVPMKRLRYFSVAERLQRMFSIPWIAELLNCSGNIEESSTHMQHPVDSPCWKFIDSKWPEFSAEKRNVRLGLATDGFNPFGMNYPHSCWPVMLVPLNLPPSHCMAKEFTMLTLLIPGPTEPGHNIDVYLQPLVDELKELWSVGKLTYDAHTKSNFTLKAILMWCVHDFPAYGHVSGCRTSGRFGCPVCGEKTDAIWLKNGRKFSYMGHRRFLPADHPFRDAKAKFDGTEEHGDAPCRLTGAQLLTKMNSVRTEFGKFTSRKEKTSNSTGKRRLTGVQLLNTMNRVRSESCRATGKRKRTVDTRIPPNMKKRSVDTSTPWSKRSILFDLPYWEDLLVRHNLDVMHIEKNFAEIFFGTIMDNKDKTKDGIPARKDLQILKIKRNLWLKERGPGKPPEMPLAPYRLSIEERKLVCMSLSNLKVPIGYCGNWKGKVCLRDFQLKSMKSHDYHILMQGLLPVFLMYCFKGHRVLIEAIRQVSLFFKVVCSKVIDIAELRIMHQRLVESICVFEMYFPPSFFVSMIHVVVHLAEEAETLGPVTTRWMYPFERMMRTFKVFGRNKNYIEGSITEQYVLDDALRHCMEYILNGREKCYKKKGKISNEDDIQEGPYPPNSSEGKRYHIPNPQYEQARRWVLMHSQENTEWEEKYDRLHVRGRRNSRNPDEYMKWLTQQFHGKAMTDFKRLVDGPSRYAVSHKAYAVNGYIFYTADAEKGMSTQNSGVSMNATTTFRASARDQNTVDDEVPYFGIVKQILELDYTTFKQTVFYCDWVRVEDKVNGWYVDPVTKQIYVNFERFMGNKKDTDEPFIHSSQATSVFYCKDESRPDRKWHIVLESPKRRSPYVNAFEDPFVFTGIAKESSLTTANLDDNSNSEEDAFDY